MNNKVAFIVELLNSKKITVPQKEKLLRLTSEEFKNLSLKDIDAHNEISAIKEQMLHIRQILQAQKMEVFAVEEIDKLEEQLIDKHNSTISQNTTISNPRSINTIYKDPKHLSEFLKLYNSTLR